MLREVPATQGESALAVPANGGDHLRTCRCTAAQHKRPKAIWRAPDFGPPTKGNDVWPAGKSCPHLADEILRAMVMVEPVRTSPAQETAKAEVEDFREALGPFVVAAEKTRMPMLFTDARAVGHAIIFANDSFLHLTGYERKDLLARDFDVLLAATIDQTEPFDATTRARIEVEFADSAGEILEIECSRRDGRRFLAAVSINPVSDDLGNVVQHCISFIDLTRHVARL
eukprot:gene39929-53996_t